MQITIFNIYKNNSFGTHYLMAKELNANKENYKLFILGENYLYAGHGAIKFIVGEGIVHDLNSDEDIALLENSNEGAFIIANTKNLDKLEEIIKSNQGGFLRTYPENHILNSFYSYTILPK